MKEEWDEVARIAEKAIAIADKILIEQRVQQAWLDGRYYQLQNMI